MTHYIANFHAEAWQGDQAVPVDLTGPSEWDVTTAVVTRPHYFFKLEPKDSDAWEDGVVDNDDYLFDRDDATIPPWIRNHHGPFTIHVRRATAEEVTAVTAEIDAYKRAYGITDPEPPLEKLLSNPVGVRERLVEGETLIPAWTRCVNCGSPIQPVVVWTSGLIDWEWNGDSGCDASPDTNEEGTGGHEPSTERPFR